MPLPWVRGVKETGFKVGSYHLATQLCHPPLSEGLKLPLKVCCKMEGPQLIPAGALEGFVTWHCPPQGQDPPPSPDTVGHGRGPPAQP